MSGLVNLELFKKVKQPCIYKYAGILKREEFDGSCSQELTSVHTRACYIMYVLHTQRIKEERSVAYMYIHMSAVYTHRRKNTHPWIPEDMLASHVIFSACCRLHEESS